MSEVESCSKHGSDICLYFDFSTTEKYQLLKKMMRIQNDLVCDGKISQKYALETVRKFSWDKYRENSFGYFSYYPQSLESMTRSGRGYQNILGGFAICLISNEEKRIGTIELICSRNKSGEKLLENIESEASGRDIILIQLFSLPEERLKTWYRNHGYFLSDLPSAGGTYLAQKVLS
jgi:hypothetical protein